MVRNESQANIMMITFVSSQRDAGSISAKDIW